MPTYEDPNEKMQRAYEKVRAFPCHKERLAEVEISVLAVYATRDKDDEPRGEALSDGDRPVLGRVKITTLEDRNDGAADARILLHGDRWGRISAPMQRAILDNCLTRIEVMMQDGKPKLDDAGRPKLRKRKYDFVLRGFHEVAERHGKSSLEVHNFRVLLLGEHGQYYMPWLDDDAPPDNVLAVAPKKKKTVAVAAADGGYARGTLPSTGLCTHIEHLDAAATVLGVAQLELQSKKPRETVVKAIKSRVLELTILPHYIAIEKGQPPAIELDLAAAVLVTTRAKPPIDLLDQMVPECRDVKVLGWVLEGEGDEEPREAVLEVVNRRIRELS